MPSYCKNQFSTPNPPTHMHTYTTVSATPTTKKPADPTANYVASSEFVTNTRPKDDKPLLVISRNVPMCHSTVPLHLSIFPTSTNLQPRKLPFILYNPIQSKQPTSQRHSETELAHA